MSLRVHASRVLRLAPTAGPMLDHRPAPMLFPDGIKRQVPHFVAVEATLEWQAIPTLVNEIYEVYARYDGGDMIDVGAYHGYYSLALAPKAQAGTTFLSLEPNPAAFPILLETLAAAKRLFPHIHFAALPVAAGTGEGAAEAFPLGAEGHRRVRSGGEGHPTVRVDVAAEMLGLGGGFLKIDVEGAELDVLRGARNVLKAHPLLMLEFHPWALETGEQEAIISLVGGHGYERQDVWPGENLSLWI